MATSPTLPTLPKALTRTLVVLAALLGVVFAAAFVMILWNDPVFAASSDLSPASPEKLAASGISFEQPYPWVKRAFRMQDGTALHAQYLPESGATTTTTTVVLVHGVLVSSLPLNRASGLLREATGADVVALDLRGHGFSGGTPGDVEHIGQYEEDLGEVVRQIRAARPGGRVILAGHSMGGGIALRYAQRSGLPPADGYLLFAPYLGWAAPTTRKEAAPTEGEPFVRVHLPRILGLKLLNVFGITAFDGLRIQFFNLPPGLPLRSYSYRASESMAPADARAAMAAVRVPLLVVVGSRDEAFRAEAYEWMVRGNRRARVEIVPDATHNGVLVDARALAAVRAWAVS